MGILPGAVDVAVAQRHVVEAVHRTVVVEVVLARELRDPVGGHGTLGGAFRRRILIGFAVDHAPAGHEDHPAGALVARSLQDVDEAGDVDPGVGDRIGDRGPHVDLRRVVVDEVETDIADQVAGTRIGDVHLDKLGAGGDVRGPSRREIVHDPHPVAPRDVGARDVGPDESGAAGDEDLAAHGGKAPMVARARPLGHGFPWDVVVESAAGDGVVCQPPCQVLQNSKGNILLHMSICNTPRRCLNPIACTD